MSTYTAKTSARDIQKMFGSNYYAATLLFPRAIRDDVFVLYAFVRLADEIVDNPEPGTDPRTDLQAFRDMWEQTFNHIRTDDPILVAFADVCERHGIEFSLTTDFLNAMSTDLSVTRYETYADLQKYMYGSAEVIGIMLLRIFDCNDPQAIPPARAMGEAMQLSNFIRDIHDDYYTRDRIYIPQEDMEKHAVSESSLVATPSDKNVRALLKYECERINNIYDFALAGVNLLPIAVRPAVRVAAALYKEIIREIQRRDYTVSEKKIRFSKCKKLRIALLYGYVKK